jgi:Flp pilus assembly protein TadD
MRSKFVHAAAAVVAVSLSGCVARGPGQLSYQTLPERRSRDGQLAQKFNQQGLEAIEAGEFDKAEELFREALEADLFYPSAHNNLGLALLKRQRWYEAAWEFQYAAKLMPKAVEPKHNLANLLEKTGDYAGAEELYEHALELSPDDIEVMGHLARVYVKTKRKPERLQELLKELAYRSDANGWDAWARRKLLTSHGQD